MNNTEDLTSNIEFIESHIGGKNDDSTNTFKDQKDLIDKNTTDYARLIDYYNKLERTKNDNDNYIERLDVKLNTNPYRLNTLPTTLDGINYSNPIIFPQEYDEYFEYLGKKGLAGLNTKILLKKNFINIDSANRDIQSTLTLDNYLKLQDNSLVFTNNTKKIKILINNADKKYVPEQKITLRGFGFYKLFFESLNLYFEDGTNKVILDIKPNFLTIIPYYDILINISGITNGISTNFRNIPLGVLNQTHKIEIFTINTDNRMGFFIPLKFYTNDDLVSTLISNCTIGFYNLGNYPISLLNANTPISEYNLTPYHIISNVGQDYIEVELINDISLTDSIKLLPGYWKDNNFYTGQNIEIASIIGVNVGYPTPNGFTVNFESTLNNIALIKIISSEIPNTQKNIIGDTLDIKTYSSSSSSSNSTNMLVTKINNKFYWDNLLDLNTYSIIIPTGYYTFVQLQNLMMELINKTPRISTLVNLYPFNNIDITLDEASNISLFKSFNIFSLPLCLQSYNQIPNASNNNYNIYSIKITHPGHNLRIGDRIYITNSLDFFKVSKIYINSTDGHLITNVINDNYYEIILENINLISDTGDTGGGLSIKIKSPNSFRLRFDYTDTFGSLIGFKYVGNSSSVTIYSSEKPNNIISNILPYTYDVSKILITNNIITPQQAIYDFNRNTFDYILLQCTKFNTVSNPNGPPYFCKFLMSGPPNTVVFNSFVQTPTYINPPIRTLSTLDFKFIYPNGQEVNFYNKNFSLTIEIDSFNNTPENTGINTFTARL